MRLIDADALMKALGITDMSCWVCDWGCRGWCTRSRDFSEACAAIEDAQTIDAAPVVRCKDCKHYKKTEASDSMMCWRNDVNGWPVYYDFNPDDFCSYGERRTDETD